MMIDDLLSGYVAWCATGDPITVYSECYFMFQWLSSRMLYQIEMTKPTTEDLLDSS